MNYQTDDLLSVQRGILVHGCNAQGKMGSGIARTIRETYPKAYNDYMTHHRQQGLRVGEVVMSVVKGTVERPELVVANAITQEFYGRDPNRIYVSYDAITQVFTTLRDYAQQHGLAIHLPLIGCGLANGDWEHEVQPRIEAATSPVTTTLFTVRPYAEELTMIRAERARAQRTGTGFRSIERAGIVGADPTPPSPSLNKTEATSKATEPLMPSRSVRFVRPRG